MGGEADTKNKYNCFVVELSALHFRKAPGPWEGGSKPLLLLVNKIDFDMLRNELKCFSDRKDVWSKEVEIDIVDQGFRKNVSEESSNLENGLVIIRWKVGKVLHLKYLSEK